MGTHSANWISAAPFGQKGGFYSSYQKGTNKLERIENNQPKLFYEVTDAVVSDSPIYKNGIRIARKFRTNTRPLPRWKWLDSDTIENNEETKKSLLNRLEEIYNWTKEKKSQEVAIVPLESNIEIKKSFFEENILSYKKAKELVEKQYANKDYFSDIYNEHPKAILEPWSPDNYSFRIFGNGKLAEIYFFEEGEGHVSPIRWKLDDEQSYTNISQRYVFRKEGKKWIATRY